jgi:phosphoglycerol transferase
LIAAIFAALVANLSPNIIYQYTHGKTETAQRAPVEAELYGLKLAQLVLPLTGHRIGSWRRIKDEYNRAPLVNENDDSALGLIGSIGFLTLLGLLVYSAFDLGRREDKSTLNLLAHLSILNLSALLLGTIGGFGAIFNLLVSPQIRGYNRISVYIAFFSFFAVALTLERARHRFFQSRGLRLALPLLIIILTILGLLDQSSSRLVPDYAGVKHVFEIDADFVQRIESSVPAGAMIFQLPVKRFPETIPIERVYDYDLFKGYIHSKQLRWSYGAMRGRLGDFWQAWVVTHPIPELVEIIALANFDGIYIDRFGYADNAAKLESELAGLTESGPLVSKDQRLSFFDLVTYRKKLAAQYSTQELKEKKIETIYPIHTVWEGGFSGLENLPGEQWRWCGPSGQLLLNNYAPYARRITVEMSIATSTEANMRIESPFFTQDMKTYPQPKPFSKTFDIPPGQHRLNFTSDAKRVFAPQDPRILVFRVINFSLKRVG